MVLKGVLNNRNLFWNNVKQHGIKTTYENVAQECVFWNNDKQHGIKTNAFNKFNFLRFWNNVKLHGIKTQLYLIDL